MSNANRQLQGKIATCYGCGEQLKSTAILVCGECLEAECGEFARLAELLREEETVEDDERNSD